MGSGRQTPERGAGDGTPRGDWAGTGLLGAKSPPSRPGGVLIAAVSSGCPARAGTARCRGGGHGGGRVQEGTSWDTEYPACSGGGRSSLAQVPQMGRGPRERPWERGMGALSERAKVTVWWARVLDEPQSLWAWTVSQAHFAA